MVAGDPEVRVLALHDADDLGVGVWQHAAGVSTDVEVDEVFVVLSGRATIEVEDGPTLEVGPGDVGLLPGRHPHAAGRSTRPCARSTSSAPEPASPRVPVP